MHESWYEIEKDRKTVINGGRGISKVMVRHQQRPALMSRSFRVIKKFLFYRLQIQRHLIRIKVMNKCGPVG